MYTLLLPQKTLLQQPMTKSKLLFAPPTNREIDKVNKMAVKIALLAFKKIFLIFKTIVNSRD